MDGSGRDDNYKRTKYEYTTQEEEEEEEEGPTPPSERKKHRTPLDALFLFIARMRERGCDALSPF
jgi:hypothetical protein